MCAHAQSRSHRQQARMQRRHARTHDATQCSGRVHDHATIQWREGREITSGSGESDAATGPCVFALAPGRVCFEILVIYLNLLARDLSHLSRRDMTCLVSKSSHLSRHDMTFGPTGEIFRSARCVRAVKKHTFAYFSTVTSQNQFKVAENITKAVKHADICFGETNQGKSVT